MSYIWKSLLKAEDEGVSKNKIEFVKGQVLSPYMEVLFDDLNAKNLPEDMKIEVNIYYRFYKIFKDLFKANYIEDIELREVLLDILLHFLGELDLKTGECRKELYKGFIYKDMMNGVFGKNLSINIKNLLVMMLELQN